MSKLIILYDLEARTVCVPKVEARLAKDTNFLHVSYYAWVIVIWMSKALGAEGVLITCNLYQDYIILSTFLGISHFVHVHVIII